MIEEIPRSDLAGSIVDIWCSDLDDRSIPPDLVNAILSAEEHERAARFGFEPDAWRFKIGRAMLRLALAMHLDKAAGTIAIRTAENGKPFLETQEIEFNISHCSGTGLIALTRIGEIGVDIEAVDPDPANREIASAYFTPAEVAFISSAQNDELRADRFTRLWTRKEAVLKATGKGILEGLSSFDVSSGSPVKVRLRSVGSIEEKCLLVKDLELSDKMKAAIAGPDASWSVKIWHVKPRILLETIRARSPHLMR